MTEPTNQPLATRAGRPPRRTAVALAACALLVGLTAAACTSSNDKTATDSNGSGGSAAAVQTYKILDAGGPLTVAAIKNGSVDVGELFSVNGAIAANGWVVLEDDKHYFPPYDAAPLIRDAVVMKHPEVREALKELGGKISADQMRRMNYAVDGEHKDVKDVVREFLGKL